MTKTLAAFLLLALATPAAAHLHIPFAVIGPAGTQFYVHSEYAGTELRNYTAGTIPAEGRLATTVFGYVPHEGTETLSCTFTDAQGDSICRPQTIGVYEPAWHFKTTCIPTFQYDPRTRNCQTSCPTRPFEPPPPGAKPKAFPNPAGPLRGDGAVKFMNFPPNTRVRIYSVTGRQIYEGRSGPEGDMHWHMNDLSGRGVGSGVYRAVADGSNSVVPFIIQR